MYKVCNKCCKEMGNDNCGCLGGWPVPKKSKTVSPETLHNWAYLPSVILHDIFSLLDKQDRLRASSVCRNWRQSLYHPNFWKEVTFSIEPYETTKARYFILMVGHIVRSAIIKFNSLSPQCVTEFTTLLQYLSTNSNLRSLIIEPSHCRIEPPQKYLVDFFNKTNTPLLVRLVQSCCRSALEEFSLGGSEDLCHHVPQFLQALVDHRPEKIHVLGLASVKDDPGNYLISDCSASLFSPFRKLQVLSIDYDIMNDELLEALDGAADLKRLIIHIHGVWTGHPSTSEAAWIKFKDKHPHCRLRITFIHAYDEVAHMHSDILKMNMPLSHIKVFFCEDINIEVLNLLSTWYPRTLRSIMWIDSQSSQTQNVAWNLVRRLGGPEANQPDPLVMAAWLCPKLEEIVLLGYKYFEEDLVAIARLRNDTLKVLEVASDDVIFSNEVYRGLSDSKDEVSKIIGKPWAPLKTTELHPVLCDPRGGDSDEYLLPKVLADLY